MTKIKEFRQLITLFKKRPINLVYLYGSRAGGRVDSFSDYDLGIVFRKNLSDQRRFALRVQLLGEIAKILGVSENEVDVIDLEKVPFLLQFNVICGKVIYCQNEEQRIAFESKVMAKYNDEHYYLDRDFWQTLTKIDHGGYFERPISHS